MRRRPPRSTRTDTLLPYTTLFRSVTGGLSSPPNNVGVCDRVISRIATRMSGRDPSAWILREPGIGRVTDSDSCSVCCSSEEGTAFMAFVLGMSRTKRRRLDLRSEAVRGGNGGVGTVRLGWVAYP